MQDPQRPNPFLRRPAQEVQGTQSSRPNPFLRKQAGGLTTSMPQADSHLFTEEVQQRASRTELSQLEAQDVEAQREKLKTILARNDINPGQRSRVEKMLAKLETASVLGIELTNRVTEPDRPGVFGLKSNLVRGVGAGVVNQAVLGTTDLAAATVQLPFRAAEALGLPKSIQRLIHLPQLREKIREAQTIMREDLDPQGYWGLGGTAVGALGGGILPFGGMNQIGMRALARVSHRAASVVYSGTLPGATFVERMAAQALATGAIDAVQLADIITDTESTWQQKGTAMGAVALMAGGSGLVASIRPIKPGSLPLDYRRTKPTVKLDDSAPEITMEGVVSPNRAAESEAFMAQAEKAQLAYARGQKINQIAKRTWEVENPDKTWDVDLSKAEQKEWMQSYRDKFDVEHPATDTNLDTSTGDQLGLPLKPGESASVGGEGVGVRAGDESGIPSGKVEEPVAPVKNPLDAQLQKLKEDMAEGKTPKASDKITKSTLTPDEEKFNRLLWLGRRKRSPRGITPDEQLEYDSITKYFEDRQKNLGGLDELPKGLTEDLPPAKPVDGEFEGDARQSPRDTPPATKGDLIIDPKAMLLLKNALEIEAINPNKFSHSQAKQIYNKLIPRHRHNLFGSTQEYSKLVMSQKLEVLKQMSQIVDGFKASRLDIELQYQLNKPKNIDIGRERLQRGRDGGDIEMMHRAEEFLARNEALDPNESNLDAVLTRIVDDLTQDLPKDMQTGIMSSIFKGEMPNHMLFVNDRAVEWLLKMDASYRPEYSLPKSTPKPRLTKPEPSTTPAAEPSLPDTPPSTTTPRRPTVEELRAEVEAAKAEVDNLKIERDQLVRDRDIDETTGYGNKDAFLRALKTAEEDPNTEITFLDIKNWKVKNDAVGQIDGDIELARFGRSIEIAMRSMKMIREGPDATIRIFRQGDEFFILHEKGRGPELIHHAKKIAGVEDVIQGDLVYPVGFRGATGGTLAEADAAIKRIKNGEPLSTKAPRKPSADAPPKPKDFHGKKLDKPFSELTKNELLELEDHFQRRFVKKKITADEHNQIKEELVQAIREKVNTKPGVKPVGKPEPLLDDPSVRKDVQPGIDKAAREIPEDTDISRFKAEKERQGFRKSIDHKVKGALSDADLLAHRDVLASKIGGVSEIEARTNGWIERLAKVNEELAIRGRLKGPPGGQMLSHPAFSGGAVGFFSSMVSPIDDEQDRFRRSIYWAGAGAAAGMLLRRSKKAMVDAVPEYQKNIRAKVKSVEDAPLDKRQGVYSRLMQAYGNIARRDVGITNVSKLVESRGLPVHQSAGKMAEIFGLWRGQTDNWLFGDEVGWYVDGVWKKAEGVKTVTQITQMVKGDMRTVGDLAAAKRELTLRGLEFPRTTGLDLEDARLMYRNTPEIYHQAVDELGKTFRALRDMSIDAGLLSKESAALMDEQGFYVAIRRMFDGEPGTTPGKIDVKGSGRSRSTGPENMFKYLKGSKLPFQNPSEALIDLIPRYMRSAELNKMATTFFDEVGQLPPSQRKLVADRLLGPDIPHLSDVTQTKIQALKKNLWEEGGMTISERHAEAILSSISDESLNVTNDIIRFYRNGELEVWKVSDPIARSFRAMQPHDLARLLETLGWATKPTNIARIGITANPVFVAYQSFRDIWQFHQNGGYAPDPSAPLGTRLVGAATSLPKSAIGQVRGWLNIMFHTGAYKEYVRAGAGGESVASQGLRIARGDIKKSTNILTKLREQPARNQFEQIAREVKTMSWREAYASLMSPIADAGRFGAYLHERGRGAGVLDAIYKSKKVGANFQNRGASVAIQAANRATLFLNPAIQSLDASRWAFTRDPVGYIARGVMGTSAISAMLWAAYNDDEEIKQLRSTPYGGKFWWMRIFGTIVKLPKPIFDGQVFGASTEAYLDHKYNQDPLTTKKWIEGMFNDASINLLPFVGVVPMSLMFNKVVGLGSPIIPQGTENLDVEYRARQNSTSLARMVSENIGGPLARKLDTRFTDNMLSPAGIDFIVSQYLGGLGSEMSKSLSIGLDAQRYRQELPPKEELPFIRSVFGQYPSMGVQAINEFYVFAERSDVAAATLEYLASTAPDKLPQYIQERHSDIVLSKLYVEARAELVDFRKSLEDIRQAPREVMSVKDRREMTQVIMRAMIDRTRAVNEAARLIRDTMTITTGK